MTNFEFIKTKDIDEIAQLLACVSFCDYCPDDECFQGATCARATKLFLESEIDNIYTEEVVN